MSDRDPWLEGYIKACDEVFRLLTMLPDSDREELRYWLAEQMGLSTEARQKYGLEEVKE